MNNANPLKPQGSLLDQGQTSPSRTRLKTAVFVVVGFHIVILGALLLNQGCKKETVPPPASSPPPPTVDTSPPQPPSFDPAYTPPPPDTAPAPGGGPGTTPAPGPGVYVPPATDTPPPTTPSTPPAGEMREHIIQKGDTFDALAKKYKVPRKAIEDANPNLVPTKLKVKDKVLIPASATPGPASGAADAAAPAGSEVEYTVKSGDNLSRIARQFGTTPAAIRKANKLKTDRILVDQKLKVPTKAAAPAPEPVPPPAPPPSSTPTYVPPATPGPGAPR